MNTQVLLGTLMGDSSIHRDRMGYYRFSCEHSLKQEGYTKWIRSKLGISTKLYYRNRYDKRTGKTYSSVSTYKGSKDLKFWHTLFYPQGKKSINQAILNLLTQEAIATWYCDDGNLYRNNGMCHLTLTVNGFVEEERKLIVNYFKDRWELNFKHTQEAVRLTSIAECKKFFSLFGSCIPKEMYYKSWEAKQLIINDLHR